jgi:arsenate reductase
MITVLFACAQRRSLADGAAWFNALADSARARAVSAGTDPGSRVHPEVVAAMSEVGFDLSVAPTTKLTPELAAGASMLITMGCGDQCPVVPGLKRDDWPLEDPKGKSVEAVRAIREEDSQPRAEVGPRGRAGERRGPDSPHSGRCGIERGRRG